MDANREKRCEERFMMEMPVMLENGMGMSRDISESGIFFVTDKPPLSAGVVKFSVKLSHVRTGKPIQLDCQGQVLRIEKLGEKFGIAARINHFWCVN